MRPTPAVLVLLLALGACAQASTAPPVPPALATSAAASDPPAAQAPPPAAPMTPAPPAQSPAANPPTTAPAADPEEAVDPQYRSCAADTECVAVERVGCCHNGWKVAVAGSQKDAYSRSFTCPQARPICPMYRRMDRRVAYCDDAVHLCALKAP